MSDTTEAWAMKAPNLIPGGWIYIHTIRFEREDSIEAARAFHIPLKGIECVRVRIEEVNP
jgi:hypothetical protein